MLSRNQVLVIACLGLFACSSDSTPSGGGTGGAGVGGSAGAAGGATGGSAGAAGTSGAAGTAGGGGAAGEAGAAGAAADGGTCDSNLLIGKWAGTNYSMRIQTDMTYQASGTPNLASIDVEGVLQVDNCKVKITDTLGKYACPGDQVGEYTFTVTDTTLAFTLVSDPCDGRRTPLTAGALTKM